MTLDEWLKKIAERKKGEAAFRALNAAYSRAWRRRAKDKRAGLIEEREAA